MTDDQHEEGAPRSGGRWNPLPQGDYDDGATAFVKLPEGGIEALLSGDSPLAAPGHGYVPPRITASPGTDDPAATGTWSTPAGGDQWPDPNAVPQDPAAGDRFTYHPAATQQWTFEEPPAEPGAGHDVTGQWSIPVAGGDLPDESGEFTTSALVEQWGGTPPATLPGGASAPWATEPADGPWGQPESGPGPHPADAPTAAEYGRAGAYAPNPPAQAPGGPADGPAEHPGPGTAPAASRAAEAADTAPSAAVGGPDHAADADEAAPADQAAGTGAADHATADGTGRTEPDAGPSGAATDRRPPAPGDATGEAAPADAGQESAEDPDEPAPAPHDDHPLASFVLRVNGADRPVTDAWIGESLLYVLRERLGLAGAKDGCSQGECGACNVQVDGRLVASCLVPAVTAAGSEVRTVEGLAADGQPSDVQQALARCGAVQCGFCVPGMAMTLHDLLEGNPAPTELETRQALCGNLCRCSGYRGVLDAVKDVVAGRETHGADDGTEADEARIPHQAGPGSGGVNPSAFDVPGVFDSPGTFGTPGVHDQHYGQDGGQG
ncbi:(2Fe-2S)-binding protein [Streptomyces collinus]|uniref:Iron-suplhur oxidoreductase n=1 Tax=Streptomyces collinus (strain DSM 40733 / Tue 365) TaxID=1214242 RepID=S5V483_STRC3|nr:(2Fe-2S)-binding protein [Streptomyces collinus]AGS69889.1 iron-suplhur oxidoreductase [Streptomyces collinus Tu 365]UJA08530.1 iron-suplhur oxidoreductase [Streptomyces collinus]UJA16605.1 iron-suplhur oxidoreductase [Streptomyces collinus]